MIDFEKLLAPIRDDSPTGSDLRYTDGDLTFSHIAENRSEEDPALAIEGDAKTANWKAVTRECEEALATRSKDLELVSFLAEGLAHTEGLSGVRDGLRLAKEMIQTYWDRLHPGFEDGEIILPIRAKPLAWLGSANCFGRAVKSIPLVRGESGEKLSWSSYELSERVDAAQTHSDPSQFQELTAAGGVTGAQWRTAVTNTPVDQIQENLAGVNECAAELEELVKLCNERFGDDAPLLTPLDDLFSEIRDCLQKALGTGEEGETVVEGEGAPRAAVSGPVGSRQQALQQLGQVAAFFRQTEPHSPISYLVQRAVRWGSMPLENLLKEVVKDSGALDHIWDTLGIKPEDEDS